MKTILLIKLQFKDVWVLHKVAFFFVFIFQLLRTLTYYTNIQLLNIMLKICENTTYFVLMIQFYFQLYRSSTGFQLYRLFLHLQYSLLFFRLS